MLSLADDTTNRTYPSLANRTYPSTTGQAVLCCGLQPLKLRVLCAHLQVVSFKERAASVKVVSFNGNGATSRRWRMRVRAAAQPVPSTSCSNTHIFRGGSDSLHVCNALSLYSPGPCWRAVQHQGVDVAVQCKQGHPGNRASLT